MTDLNMSNTEYFNYSDAHKDAYGYRPRDDYARFDALTREEARAEMHIIYADIERSIEEQKSFEEAAIESFIEKIKEEAEMFDVSINKAIERLFIVSDAFDGAAYFDGSYFCYLNGLPYRLHPWFNTFMKSRGY